MSKKNTLPEAQVSTQTGLSRERIRELRASMKEGVHWQKSAGGAIEYTPKGISVLEYDIATAAQNKAPPDPIPEPFDAARWKQEAEASISISKTHWLVPVSVKLEPSNSSPWPEFRMTVVGVPRNTKILDCRAVENGKSALVHVRDNTFFRAGMVITARMLGQTYEYAGKLPRRKGVL